MKKTKTLICLFFVAAALLLLSSCGNSAQDEYDNMMGTNVTLSGVWISDYTTYEHDGKSYSGYVKLNFISENELQFETPYGISKVHKYSRNTNMLNIYDAYSDFDMSYTISLVFDGTSFQATGFNFLTALAGIPDLKYVKNADYAFTKDPSIADINDPGTYLVFEEVWPTDNYKITGYVEGCGITDITIPEEYNGHKVVSIEYDIFKGNKDIKRVTIPDSLLSYNDSVTFKDCSSLEYVKLPYEMTTIPSYCFSGCTSLKTIEFSPQLVQIGEFAFQNCKSLESFTIPETVLYISTYAFTYCDKLRSVVFNNSNNNSTIYLHDYVFDNCSALESVILPEGLESINMSTFYGCSSLKEIEFPSTLKIIYNNVNGYNILSYLEKVTFKGELDAIGDNTFAYGKLKSIDWSKGVKSIGKNVFGGTPLETIEIPASITSINSDAFAGSNLKEIIFHVTSSNRHLINETNNNWGAYSAKLTQVSY